MLTRTPRPKYQRAPGIIRLGIIVAALFFVMASSAMAYSGSATAYSGCDGSTSRTASGARARYGYAANNWLRLGTVIKVTRPEGGIFVGDRRRRYFRIMDRGGPGFALDIWMSCSAMNAWGRRNVSFRVVSNGTH